MRKVKNNLSAIQHLIKLNVMKEQLNFVRTSVLAEEEVTLQF